MIALAGLSRSMRGVAWHGPARSGRDRHANVFRRDSFARRLLGDLRLQLVQRTLIRTGSDAALARINAAFLREAASVRSFNES
jgi:hypothetical protein